LAPRTFGVRGSAKIRKHDRHFDNCLPATVVDGRRRYIVDHVDVMGNDYEKGDFEGLDVTSRHRRAEDGDARARVAGRSRRRAGRTVPLKVMFRTYRGDEIVRTMPIEIPARDRIAVAAGLGRRPSREERAA